MSQVHPETGESPEEVKERLDNALDEHLSEEEEETQKALESLVSSTIDETEYHTVTLTGGVDVEVKDSLPGRLERKANRLEDAEGVDDAVPTVAEIMGELIQSDGYGNPEVWNAFYEELGSTLLLDNFERVTQPFFDSKLKQQKEMQRRREDVDGFRQK